MHQSATGGSIEDLDGFVFSYFSARPAFDSIFGGLVKLKANIEGTVASSMHTPAGTGNDGMFPGLSN